jgi:hypothetical protein
MQDERPLWRWRSAAVAPGPAQCPGAIAAIRRSCDGCNQRCEPFSWTEPAGIILANRTGRPLTDHKWGVLACDLTRQSPSPVGDLPSSHGLHRAGQWSVRAAGAGKQVQRADVAKHDPVGRPAVPVAEEPLPDDLRVVLVLQRQPAGGAALRSRTRRCRSSAGGACAACSGTAVLGWHHANTRCW